MTPPGSQPNDGSPGAEGSPAPGNNNERPFFKQPLRVLLLAVVLVVLVLLGTWYWFYSQQFVSTENAYLQATITRVAAQVSGQILAVPVAEHERVEKGDVLVRIDPSAYRVALERAQTRLASARAQLEQARAQLAVAKARVEKVRAKLTVARVQAENAAADLARLKAVDPRAVAAQKLEDVADRVDRARAQKRAAKKRLAAAKAKAEAATAAVAAAKAAISEAKARVRAAELKLSYTTITAPTDGQVAKLAVDPGEYVRPGQVLAAVVSNEVWVKANFKETQITHMRPGQPVAIHIDAYPDRSFQGHVQSIQRATGSQFALLPPQNATGNFVKVVQRVPVKIVFNEPPDLRIPAAGLSVVPTVKVLEDPPWPWSDGSEK